uniref:Uncharacterized protein n=1 Tax=Clastoptera arizonana TaxID=38151 RepID=A0A1B6CXE3_9HEMI
MYLPNDNQWNSFSTKTEMKIIAVVNLILGVSLVVCSGSYADVILTPEEIAPCTELSHLQVARRLLKVLFFISTLGGIETVLSASLVVAIYKSMVPIILMWIIVYTSIVATLTGCVVVYCYILITEGVQTGDAGTLMFLLMKLGFITFSLMVAHKFYTTSRRQRHYVSISTIGSLPGRRM